MFSGNQQILFEWSALHLRMLKPDGQLIEPDPAPLSTEEITDVLKALADHPAYEGQTVSIPDRDGKRTLLRDGKIVPGGTDPDHDQVMPYGASIMVRDERVE